MRTPLLARPLVAALLAVPLVMASSLDSIGYIHHHLGDRERATAYRRQALRLYRELGDRNGEVETLTHLGDTYLAGGDRDAARDAWHRALEILDELGHADAEQVRAKLRQLGHE